MILLCVGGGGGGLIYGCLSVCFVGISLCMDFSLCDICMCVYEHLCVYTYKSYIYVYVYTRTCIDRHTYEAIFLIRSRDNPPQFKEKRGR